MTDAQGDESRTGDAAVDGRRDGLLRLEGINTYYGESHVLQDVSISIPENDIVAMLGRNGAGKTTTIRSIMGFVPPRSGRIVYKGQDIVGAETHEIRQRGIAVVPEDRGIFPDLSVAENLRLASKPGEDASSVYDRFPRLDERRTQLAGTLSGGEQQMLAIARGLVGPETDLILLDEPTEGLAPQIRDDVRDTVREINAAGMTFLIVEQNLKIALDLADYVYILEGGEIKFHGDTDRLRENTGVIRKHLAV